MDVSLYYGKSTLKIKVPDESVIIEPQYIPGIPDENGAIKGTLRNPVNSSSLNKSVFRGQKVGISVCDITRASPTKTVLPIVLQELSHIEKSDITIFIATGTHRSNSPAELKSMLGDKVINGGYKIQNHDSSLKSELSYLGLTDNNIPIWLNKKWLETDYKITLGFVEPHFFAGFSGGPKMICPGLAGLDTIMQLHGADMIAHKNSTWGLTDGNPIHDTIKEISTKHPSDFTVDVTINKNRNITSVLAGEMFSVHKSLCGFVKSTSMCKVNSEFDIVITTNGGYPLDLNLYQSIKGISAAFQVVKKNRGSIICASECSDGIPEHGLFKQILTSQPSPEKLISMIETPNYSQQDQWQVQIQSQILQEADIYFKSDYLSDLEIKKSHLLPISNIDVTLEDLIKKYGSNTTVCVIPEGPQSIPYI